jgi:polyhydroxyalkanoate synthase
VNAAAAEPDAVAERVLVEVERTIARSIRGVEYIASPAPAVGVTPKELVRKDGTFNLYHYHPLADEIYRVPILIVMATSNRGYVLDLARGSSFVEFLLRSGYDVYMIDWTPPRPDEKTPALRGTTRTVSSPRASRPCSAAPASAR